MGEMHVIRNPKSKTKNQKWSLPFAVTLLIAAPMLWLFGPALLNNRTFVFRDAAHYYYPLFKFTCHQLAQGHLPIWNPWEETGRPLLADATASVCYPGKILFALPLPYATNYKLYTIAHLALAAASAYWLARSWGADVSGAGLCAIAYSLGGAVLFQYCNVIFLVGAAWLPLAVWAVDRTLLARSMKAAIALGVCLSLMTLGGDPQMAYHVGLLGGLYAWILRGRGKVEGRVYF
jgi:hypothetical protein